MEEKHREETASRLQREARDAAARAAEADEADRMALRAGAALIIQAVWRGHMVRKQLL
jgi:hypothetical protein